MASKKTTSAGTTGGGYSQDKSKGSRSPRCGSDEEQRDERLPRDQPGAYHPPGLSARQGNSGSHASRPGRLAVQAIFWLIVWSLIFGVWKVGRALIANGLPTIRIEWPDRDQDTTPLAKWVKKNRPGLEADYPAVGASQADPLVRHRAVT